MTTSGAKSMAGGADAGYSDERRFRDVQWFADLMSIPLTQVYRLIRNGQGPPHMKVGRLIRLDQGLVEKWLQERTQGGERPG